MTASRTSTSKKPAAKSAAAKKPAKKSAAAKTSAAVKKSVAKKKAAASTAPAALLLTPGAGADRTHHTLVAIEQAAKAARSMTVGRVDFPYRIAGKRAPDKAPVAVAHLRAEATRLVRRAGCAPDALVLGGRSYGGRMCSLAVAEGLPSRGLVLLSYPLHPPGKPDTLRIDHFPQITVPVLFVSGDRDAFGTPDELTAHAKAIAGPVTHVWLKGGHDPRNQDDVIASTVIDWLTSL